VTLTEPLPELLGDTRRDRLAALSLPTEAVAWFERCRKLREFENRRLLAKPAPDDLRAHRVIVTDLIADGEILAWQARKEPADLSSANFTVEDIEAEASLLRDNFRMFHEPMPAAEAEKILEAAFAGSRT